MIKLNIHEAKTHLSHYLEEVERGETILLCKRNRPLAEIRPLAVRRSKQRPIGLAKGKFTVPASFFEELPEETLALFQGEFA
ncbi:MAG TPA: type II toxin-antitoxin system prevent-host-death family antitoxin [Thermodesulfovibrionales bacterium]|nr:type II toxin-antitoxin system prevent-host-death family antitoxin [Thermodesulfovibrionales bacterium]